MSKFHEEVKNLFGIDNNNVMIDCETMSLAGNAAVLQIGAARFSVEGVQETIEINLSLAESMASGFNVSASTMMWWLGQDDDAREALLNGQEDALSIKDALTMLTYFLGHNQCDNPKIWGNDPSADNRWVAELYRNAGMDQPWKHYNNRCYRTFCAERKYLAIKRPEATIKHSAMGDAVAQAEHMVHLMHAEVVKTAPSLMSYEQEQERVREAREAREARAEAEKLKKELGLIKSRAVDNLLVDQAWDQWET